MSGQIAFDIPHSKLQRRVIYEASKDKQRRLYSLDAISNRGSDLPRCKRYLRTMVLSSDTAMLPIAHCPACTWRARGVGGGMTAAGPQAPAIHPARPLDLLSSEHSKPPELCQLCYRRIRSEESIQIRFRQASTDSVREACRSSLKHERFRTSLALNSLT